MPCLIRSTEFCPYIIHMLQIRQLNQEYIAKCNNKHLQNLLTFVTAYPYKVLSFHKQFTSLPLLLSYCCLPLSSTPWPLLSAIVLVGILTYIPWGYIPSCNHFTVQPQHLADRNSYESCTLGLARYTEIPIISPFVCSKTVTGSYICYRKLP